MEDTKSNPEKDVGILGGLFQTVVNDLRGSSPIWEDFTYKSIKLHSSLKTTVVTIGAFLEAFQKVADMATNSKGATREIGSALTRLCMRHRSLESHLKLLTNSILDNLVAPLQEKLEDWKKAVAQLDKDHSKEYKKAKQEIKKSASDTMRLQKKVKKSASHGKSDMQHKLESAMMEVNTKYHQLEETEKNSVRAALIEERSRFCLFITCLKPFVDHELKLLTEISHISEIMESLCMQASEPSVLPPSSEQVILDLKGVDTASWNLNQASSGHDHELEGDCDSTPTTPSDNTPSASSTWNNWPNLPGGPKIESSRPHTISTAYEKGHSRPALKPEMFDPPQEDIEMRPKMNRSTSQNAQKRPSATISKLQPVLPPHCPKPKGIFVAPPVLPPGVQHIYANMSELSEPQAELSPDDAEPTTPTSVTAPGNNFESSAGQRLLDLEQAMEQMDKCTAGLKIDIEHAPGHREETTVRSPVENKDGEVDIFAGVVLEINRQPKIQQNTSLELAKAIRELQASTAALTAYDAENYMPGSATQGSANFDTESRISKVSLPCSSGYGTMDSTPASSEDKIASGGHEVISPESDATIYEELDDCTLTEDKFESETKYMTLPRVGDTVLRTGIQPQRPASTTGLMLSDPNQTRPNLGSQKPPPPVRRTASISSAAPMHVQKMRASPMRQLSAEDHSFVGESEGPYAELQYIQQSIHQHPIADPSVGHAQGVIENPYTHIPGHASAIVVQSLNAKFTVQPHTPQSYDFQASMVDGSAHMAKPPPPVVMQKPGKPASNIPPPPSATAAWQQASYPQVAHDVLYSTARPPSKSLPNSGQHVSQAQSGHYNSQAQAGHYNSQVHPHPGQGVAHGGHQVLPHHPPYGHQQHNSSTHSGYQANPTSGAAYSHHQQMHPYARQSHHPQMMEQQHHNQTQQQHPPPEDDFPLPPTIEELQEMERIYSRTSHPAADPLKRVQAPRQNDNVQASFLMELKRKVSLDDESAA
ncbi:protein MTSS 2-like isoform X9 [Biomphalaria glabrata]|uniref:Protein MTSS 2-like isoform X9 n=1 Tax=Biomphalaria glabrata TaxID=6526 RepID=A0A9W3AUB6_BIOGL|nr:protein MTSS 2-like isoform X9 [Biomphalaria glabrata]